MSIHVSVRFETHRRFVVSEVGGLEKHVQLQFVLQEYDGTSSQIYLSAWRCNISAAIRYKSDRPLLVILLPPDFLFCSNTTIFSQDPVGFRSTLPLPSK